MVAHTNPPSEAKRLIACQVAAILAERRRPRIVAELGRRLPQADSAQRARAIAALLQHLASSVEQHALATYVAGVDMVAAIPEDTAARWLDAALEDAIAAARCP